MRELIITVSDEDAAEILSWVTVDAPQAPGGHHRVFVTSSVPALHMWNVESVKEVNPVSSEDEEFRYRPEDDIAPAVIRLVSFNGRRVVGDPVLDGGDVLVTYEDGTTGVVLPEMVIEYRRVKPRVLFRKP